MKSYNEYFVDNNSCGKKIKDFLKNDLGLSKRSIISLKKNMGIRINEIPIYVDYILKQGDRLELLCKEELHQDIVPQEMDLDIIYEDEYIIVLNKPASMPVHPTKNHYTGTLSNGLCNYFIQKKDSFPIRPINRLDKDTSGLVVFAKSSHVQYVFSKLENKDFQKEYIAIVQGIVKNSQGIIDMPIVRESDISIKRIVSDKGNNALTYYTVLKRLKDSTILKVKLGTGRTHQIRVHMSYLGHPIVGDDIYGSKSEIISRQALHAFRINLLHPFLEKRIKILAKLPDDIKKLIYES